MPFAKVNGTDYYYELHGKGHPVVLISGYSCDHNQWMPILDPLSKQFQVLVFDNRGVGQTKDKNEPLSLKSMAKDTIDLAEHLGLKKPHIVGQSMGGMIAQIIGAEHGARISKLVLLVTAHKLRRATILGLRSIISMIECKVPFDEVFKVILAWVFGEAFLSDKKKIDLLHQIMINNPYPQSLENLKRQSKLLDSFDGAHLSIQVPVLVINGKEDLIVLPEEGEKLAKHHKASFKLLNGAHELITESSKELVDLLSAFF